MTSYHITPSDDVKPCNASKQDKCPYSGNNGDENHYSTIAEARVSVEKKLEKQFRKLEELSKVLFKENSVGWSEEENKRRTNSLIEEYGLFTNLIKALDAGSGGKYGEAVGMYRYSDFKPLNRILSNFSFNEILKMDTLEAKRIIALQELLKMYPKATSNPHRLYRLQKIPKKIGKEDFLKKFKPGETYTHPGFLSTSEDVSIPLVYHEKDQTGDSIIFDIVSSRGASLQESEETPGNVQSFEKERLLEAGVSFKVISAGYESFSLDASRGKFLDEFQVRDNSPVKVFVVKLVDEEFFDY